jgi:small GTP-binding protein
MDRPKTTGLLLIVVLAALGYALVKLPSEVIEQYDRAVQLGPGWGYGYLAIVGTGLVLLVTALLWLVGQLWSATRHKRQRKLRQSKNPSELSRAEKEKELNSNLEEVANLKQTDGVAAGVRRELDPLVDRVQEKQESEQLEIVAFGTISSGKSSLLNALAGRDVFATNPEGGTTTNRNEIRWPGQDRVTLVDTPGLDEVDGESRETVAGEAARDADMVLMVVDGPLRDTEFGLLEKLGQMEKRILVCLNKEDWYDAEEQASLIGQIQQQLAGIVADDDIVTVRARPTQRLRRRVMPDGREIEETVDVDMDIQPLADRMLKIVRRDGQELLLANLLLRSRGLVEEARRRVKSSLDDQAWSTVDKYMWSAGGAAALSPFPLVDLAAGCAISSKMVLDLARVYRQGLDTDMAVNLLGEQGKNLLAVLGSSTATPLVASAVASLIKTVPGIGTITGQLMQGVVQALVTRWIGAVFIEYFRNEMQEPPGGLAALARRQWERMTSLGELRKLVRVARKQLDGNDQE